MSQELARLWPLIERDIIRIMPGPPLPAPKRLTGREIIAAIAEKHGLRPNDLLGPCRRRKFAWPRQEAMWEMRQKTKLSLPQIGELLGGRDHTTVVHGIRAHEARLASALHKH